MVQKVTLGLGIAAMIVLGGCSCKSAQGMAPKYVHIPTASVGYATNIYSAADKLVQRVLTCDAIKQNKAAPFVLTSFVNVHDFRQTSDFGRMLSELVLSELAKRGVNVVDFRGRDNIVVNEDGEFFLSRDARKISKKIANSYVLVGTYGLYGNELVVTARLIDNKSGKVLIATNERLKDKKSVMMALRNRCEGLGCGAKNIRYISIVNDEE